jgi:hypothetical protein
VSLCTTGLRDPGPQIPDCINPSKGGTGPHAAAAPVTPAETCPDCLPPSSSLDSLESGSQADDALELPASWYGDSSFDLCPASAEETSFRHGGWSPRRRKVWDALLRTHASQHRLQAFKYCGASLWVQKSLAGDDLRLVANYCHDRFCVPCQTGRAANIAKQIEAIIRDRSPRFLTLTLRASPTPLNDQIDRLYREFAALRRRAAWRSKVVGGAAFLEVKIGERSGLWHPHLHVLIEGTYFDQRALSREWHSVTGDSSIVDIRAIDRAEDRARYVTKYVTKPADASVFAVQALLDEFMLAMKGRRLMFTFGTWTKIKLQPDPDEAGEWTNVGGVDALMNRARDGDEEAQRWISAVARKYPGFAAAYGLLDTS